MLDKLITFILKIFGLLKSKEEEPQVKPTKPTEPKPVNPETKPEDTETKPTEQTTTVTDTTTNEPSEPIVYDIDSEWNYGYWKEAKTYDDIKATLKEAQKNNRPILVALSKPTGCNNCTNYWRHVTCDGVFDHDDACDLIKKKHPIVAFAKEKKLLMLYISPSKMPNIASKIMGKEYDAYLHKPVYYPIYFVIKVKNDINLDEVPANDKILNAGNDVSDTVDFIMGYIGISGKPVLDYQGNKTDLTVKTNDDGWNVFKSNMEAVFADTSKTHGVTL